MFNGRFIYIFLICVLIYGIPSVNFAQSDSLAGKLEVYKYPNPNIDTSRFNIFPEKLNRKKIALVLSGGGARGLSQIGVLSVLEKYDVNIDMIVGTSIGAITGGLYSSGYSPEEMVGITGSVDWKSKLSLTNKYEREFLFVDQKKSQDRGFLTISLDGFKPMLPTSLSSGQQMSDLINIFLMNARYKPRKDFSDIKIPFYAVATDLDKGKRVVLNKGNISECIKASFTYPLLYSPTKVEGNDLVDGGLTSNIPVDVAKEFGADFTITVNSTSPLKTSEELKNPINTADQILSITMAQLNEEQLKKSDFVINPKLGNLGATEFENVNYIVDKGKIATEEIVKDIISRIDSLEDKASLNFNNFVFNGNVTFALKNISDSLKNEIVKEQQNTFVRYVTIEKRLRDIYKTGNFSSVWAEIYKSGTNTEIVYKANQNVKLHSLKVGFNFSDKTKKADYYLILWDTLNTGNTDPANKTVPSTVNTSMLNRISEIVNTFGKDNLNKTANRNSMFEFYEKLLGGVRKDGYSAIDIKRFYLDDNGILNVDFSEGFISDIKIKGNYKTRKSLLLSETDVSFDKPVLKNSLVESLGGIVGTNLFQQVSMYFDYKDTSVYYPSLNFNVVEKSTRNIRISFRLDNERKFQAYVDFRNENLFGTGNETGITFKGGLRDREYMGELKSNRFFGSIFTYNWSVYYRFRNIYDYTQSIVNSELVRTQNGEYRDIRYGSSFLVGTQMKRFGTVFGQLLYENLSRESVQGTFPSEGDLKLFKLRIGGKIDSEDIYPFATRGSKINYIYESSRNQLSSGVTFTKLSFDIIHNIALGSPSVLRPKFVFGFADKTTPDYEVFSLGGEDSFYGMVEDEMRGRQVLLASLEYRYRLPVKFFFDTYLSARYDLGRAWENAEDIRFKDLKHGIGFAILFDTPLGKTSLSAGKMFIITKGLTSESLNWGPTTFYFSMGYNL